MSFILSLFLGKFRLWAYLGIILAIISSYGYVYYKGRSDCNASWQAYHAEQLRKAREGSKVIVREDEMARVEDDKSDAAYDKESEKILNETKDPDHECLDSATERRLLDGWDQ